MKTIGLLGGMSWESTAVYYRLINQEISRQLGGLHSAKILLDSVDFEQISAWQKSDDWDLAAEYLGQRAKALESAGADAIVICTNTMHKVAEQISQHITIPILCIIDATGHRLNQLGFDKVGILGTEFTMTQPFYASKYSEEFGVSLVAPVESQRAEIHRIIFNELCRGIVKEESKQVYLDVIDSLHNSGCQAVVLGCTEIGMLITSQDTSVPIVDTTQEHSLAIAKWMLTYD